MSRDSKQLDESGRFWKQNAGDLSLPDIMPEAAEAVMSIKIFAVPRIAAAILSSAVFFIIIMTACAAADTSDPADDGSAGDTALSGGDSPPAAFSKIDIRIDGRTSLTAELSGNSSARALAGLLRQRGSLTIQMRDYGNFEKVGDLPVSLPENDQRITTVSGDLILYQGKSISIYYDENTWNFTRLGKITGVNQSQLKAILGTGEVTAVFSPAEE